MVVYLKPQRFVILKLESLVERFTLPKVEMKINPSILDVLTKLKVIFNI